MVLSIVGLCVFIFGAYAYGSVVALSLRHRRPVWPAHVGPCPRPPGAAWVGLAMFVVCTAWFVLHSIIEVRHLLGAPASRQDDLFDLAALELVFAFPGFIFHTVLVETSCDPRRPRPPARGWWRRRWRLLMNALER
jgi:hypothetical protein